MYMCMYICMYMYSTCTLKLWRVASLTVNIVRQAAFQSGEDEVGLATMGRACSVTSLSVVTGGVP